jgi:hypothetical protein
VHRFGTCYNFTIHRFKILLNKISNNKRNEIKHIQIDKFLNDDKIHIKTNAHAFINKHLDVRSFNLLHSND